MLSRVAGEGDKIFSDAARRSGLSRVKGQIINNTVTVSWPSPSTGFVLQQNNNANNVAGWSTFGGTINDNGTIKSMTISPPTGNLFFRLKQ